LWQSSALFTKYITPMDKMFQVTVGNHEGICQTPADTCLKQIPGGLFQDLRSPIIEAREDVARQVNSALVLLYWQVDKRIRQDILKEKRAGYGQHIVARLSQQLPEEFGEGWSRYNLSRMITRYTKSPP
jgi:hypothetical protein